MVISILILFFDFVFWFRVTFRRDGLWIREVVKYSSVFRGKHSRKYRTGSNSRTSLFSVHYSHSNANILKIIENRLIHKFPSTFAGNNSPRAHITHPQCAGVTVEFRNRTWNRFVSAFLHTGGSHSIIHRTAIWFCRKSSPGTKRYISSPRENVPSNLLRSDLYDTRPNKYFVSEHAPPIEHAIRTVRATLNASRQTVAWINKNTRRQQTHTSQRDRRAHG